MNIDEVIDRGAQEAAVVEDTDLIEEPAANGQRARVAPPTLPPLPAEFWTARPRLAHIRDAAHSRQRSADAVLHCVFARIAAFRPTAVRIDTGVGSPASLNYMGAMVATSGAGKSSCVGISRDLIPAPRDYELADPLPIGSGEGLAEAYMGMVTRAATPEEKSGKIRQQVRHHALFYVDEGQRLIAESERRGSTLNETLRRAWGGETLGQFNATPDRTRVVKDYSFGLMVGFQIDTVLPLLRDTATGTVQRLAWTTVVDPSIPDDPPSWPGKLGLRLLDHFERYSIDQDLRQEIRAEDLAHARGEMRRDPLDEHEPLLRLKFAAFLATIDDRHHITRDDWRLGGMIYETSCTTRNLIIDYGRAKDRERQHEERREHANRALAADRAVKSDQATVARVAGVLFRKAKHATKPLSSADLQRAVASRDREYLDRSTDYAVQQGWLAEDDGRFTAGASQP